MKRTIIVFLALFLLIGVLGAGKSFSQPIYDSLKAGDSLNIHKVGTNGQMYYGMIYLKNMADKTDTVFVYKYTQKGNLIKSGLVNLDSSGQIVDRIILPGDGGKFHTYGINHIYPGALYIFFSNVAYFADRRILYEINYYTFKY